MQIIPATPDHIPAITELYNHNVATSTAIWTLTAATPAQRLEWLSARKQAGFPVFVAVDDDVVLGFASYGTFRPAEGYRNTVEHSVYVAPQAQRRGVARALMQALIDHAQAAGLHAMIGAVETGNTASIALHEQMGFHKVGVLPQIGSKFGKWLDLALMHRLLDEDPPKGR